LPATGQFCQPHLERAGIEVAATIIIGGEPMCRACFRGLPVNPKENLDRLNTILDPPFVQPKKKPSQTHAEPEPCSPMRSSLSPYVRFTVTL